jgi:hypothetical protein
MTGFNVEGFLTLQEIQSEASVLTDMELKAYLNSLSPTDQQSLLGGAIQSAVDNTKKQKETTFKQAMNNVINVNNSITQAGYYLSRTQDLTNMAGDINEVAAKQAQASLINKDVATRQYQINEWSSSNKLDTLFFLQVLFITLTLLGALYFLVKMGIVPNFLFILLSMILLTGALLTLFIRWRYTSTVRDPTYWNRRRFPGPAS